MQSGTFNFKDRWIAALYDFRGNVYEQRQHGRYQNDPTEKRG
jgi:hypothetical protein